MKMSTPQSLDGDDLAHYELMFDEKSLGSQQKRGFPSSRNWLSLVAAAMGCVALLLVLALVTSVTVLIWDPNSRLHQVFASESQSEDDETKAFACVPCLRLLKDPAAGVASDPLVRQLQIQGGEDGREDCCAYTSHQITVLFESMMRLNDLDPLPLASYEAGDFKFSPVSAHKRLYPKEMSDDFGVPKFPALSQVCELKEDDSAYGLEHHRGVNISSSGLRILHGGLYYIYASLQFWPQSKHPCADFRYQTFVAYVEKIPWRRSGAETILKVLHSCCDQCSNSQETRFTGGMFVLQPGDQIQVKVSGYDLVHFEPQTSFVGLAMLGSPQPESETNED
ncbi:hypothetical protein EGW08_006373 [Elysia chlorotica]|uniref:THD domain-containing protein n=1 Tax=Elysia chlorotica TaxID=188477 RepID=A0A3S1A979_ELYCH|nr:hypothetical protein EGW08_006373 [Elysia chlorotica]